MQTDSLILLLKSSQNRNPHNTSLKKAFLQLHVAIIFAGFTAILGKLIQLNEGLLTFYRMLLSALILAAFLS